jgi:hypothetical protein
MAASTAAVIVEWLEPIESPRSHMQERMGMSAAYRHHTLAHMEAFQFFPLGIDEMQT